MSSSLLLSKRLVPVVEGTDVPVRGLAEQQAVDGAHRAGRRIFRWHLVLVLAATCLASCAVWQDRVGDARLSDMGGLIAALVPLGVSLVVGRFEADSTQRAAFLQDQFDRFYLGLPAGVPDAAMSETHLEILRSSSKTSPTQLAEWYPDLAGRDPGFAALGIQRMNLRWDVPQRRAMATVSLMAGFVWLLVGLGIWTQTSWTSVDFLLIWMGPAVAVWELSISSAHRHWDLASAKSDLAEVVEAGLNSDWLGRPTALGLADIVQAHLTQLRSEAPRVPPMIGRIAGARQAATARSNFDLAAPVDVQPQAEPRSGS